MKTFSRLSVLTLLFLGIAFMLVGSTVYAQQDKLEVFTAGGQAEYDIGDPVSVTFVVTPEKAVTLQITASGVNITNIQGSLLTGTPGNYTTDAKTGSLKVDGIITSSGAYIAAMWDRGAADDLSARADLGGKPQAPRIVVDPPNVNDTGLSAPLQVGDTFTQKIYARDFIPPIADIKDLSAWQMDITYNSKILQFVDATEGDFLEEGGVDALFMASNSASKGMGTIKAHQARIGATDLTTDPDTLTAPVAGVTGSGLLMTVEFKLLEFAEEALGLSNIQLSDSSMNNLGALTTVPSDLLNAAESAAAIEAVNATRSQASRVSYHVVVNPIVATHRFPAVDVNRDGMVDVMDLVAVASALRTVPGHPVPGDNTNAGTVTNPRADVNNDGFVNTLDIMAVASSASWGQAVTTINVRGANHAEAKGNAPQLPVAANVTHETIQRWVGILRVEDDGSAIFDLGIANLEALLASIIPTETRLLLNYPNPFNPETWIPYQLAEATDVRVMIHSVNGSLIRMLELGHQAAGTYKGKSQAAYWDGRNELGEQVASGLYFYTLTAGDFSATGKMLIRK